MVTKRLFIACCVALLAPGADLRADVGDPLDPFDPFEAYPDRPEPPSSDDAKTATELIDDAELLMLQERPLDARTKLLKALAKDPAAYRAHMNLANYYLSHVGHFRLALKYTKQALALFNDQNGPPPYFNRVTKLEHSQLYFLLAHIRLNLDDYAGALEALDEFQSFGYVAPWYADSRAWVLMKLGRLDEATRIARLGALDPATPGRTLNMLGILLSMQHEREASIEVFRQAIAYEFSLGSLGSPATPLNNSGEVFKETFADDKAESAWLRATSLPDGCEHVLPALNLAILYIDQANFEGAKRAIDNFEGCVAQFPLRNGEEHRALVHLARGRIALHTGDVDGALEHLEAAAARRQWFGKIGTSEEDLRAGVFASLAQALRAKNHHLELTVFDSWSARLQASRERATNATRAWWFGRRARQILAEDLANFEDIYVRNTDSMLEYPTLGHLLRAIPARFLEQRLEVERRSDDRSLATNFYELWLAENYFAHGKSERGWELLEGVLARARPDFDQLLSVRARIVALENLDHDSTEYRHFAESVFTTSRAQLRNAGLPLPVATVGMPPDISQHLAHSAFLPTSADTAFSVTYDFTAGEHGFQFTDRRNFIGTIKVRGNDLVETMHKLADEVFTEGLS